MSRSIYVVKSEPGPVKIGIATKPRLRIAGLRTASAVPLSLEYIGECGDDDAIARVESAVHESLRHSHCRGEWFSVSPKDAIAAVLSAANRLGYELVPAPIRPIRHRRSSGRAISVRLSEDIKVPIQSAAKDDTRTVTSYVEKLIIEDLKKKGYLKK